MLGLTRTTRMPAFWETSCFTLHWGKLSQRFTTSWWPTHPISEIIVHPPWKTPQHGIRFLQSFSAIYNHGNPGHIAPETWPLPSKLPDERLALPWTNILRLKAPPCNTSRTKLWRTKYDMTLKLIKLVLVTELNKKWRCCEELEI